eukprot:g40744.t1
MITASMQAVIAPYSQKSPISNKKTKATCPATYLSSTSKPTNWRKKITNQQQTETQKIEQAQQDIEQNKKRLDSQESDVRKLSGGVDSLRQETKQMLQQLQDIKAQQQRTEGNFSTTCMANERKRMSTTHIKECDPIFELVITRISYIQINIT